MLVFTNKSEVKTKFYYPFKRYKLTSLYLWYIAHPSLELVMDYGFAIVGIVCRAIHCVGALLTFCTHTRRCSWCSASFDFNCGRNGDIFDALCIVDTMPRFFFTPRISTTIFVAIVPFKRIIKSSIKFTFVCKN